MTITKKFDLEILASLMFIAAVGSFYAWNLNRQTQPIHLTTPIIAGGDLNPVDVKTNPVLRVDTAMQPTPDGTKHLVMTLTHNINGSLDYVFKAIDVASGNEQIVYTASGSASEQMSIPFNTWSPDNKYLFIQKHNGDALVFSASGEDIIQGEKYLEVKDLFDAGGRQYIYHETTGWASPTLLIVNTTNIDGKKGSSYWFEVPSKAIIELSSQF